MADFKLFIKIDFQLITNINETEKGKRFAYLFEFS